TAGSAHVLLSHLRQNTSAARFRPDPSDLFTEKWMKRRSLLLVLASVVASMGAMQRSSNFVVHAPTPQIAAQVAQYAEHYRKEKALLWLGSEMPPWPQPCPLHVTVTMEPPSGATTFTFGHNQVLSMRMEIKGPLDRLLSSVLPHEITHTVFAYHFRCPVPR